MKLRLFLPADDRLDEAAPLAWMLLDARGALLREDRTPLSGAPRADEVEALLPASRVLFARLRLPKVGAATIRELLPYAVEDRLVADPAQIHAVAGRTGPGGETVVAVVDRGWLSGALATLARAGLAPRRAVCESALLAGGHRDWHVVWRASQAFLVDDEGVAVAFDRPAGGDLPLAIRIALDEAAGRGEKPAEVRVHLEPGASPPELARWSGQAGVAFASGAQWPALAAAPIPAGTIDLLSGEFAVRGRLAGGFRIPRAALALGATIAALHLGFTAIDAARLGAERDRLAARQEAIFRAAFPEATTVVDPELQLARNLADLKRSRGLAADDDFLAQATRLARSRGGEPLGSLVYSGGRLEARAPGAGLAEARR